MTGWQRLRIVLSVIYWVAAVTLATGVYFGVRNTQDFEVAGSSTTVAAAATPGRPAPSTTRETAGSASNAHNGDKVDLTIALTAAEELADFYKQYPAMKPAQPSAGSAFIPPAVILGIAAVFYAIAAAIWWAWIRSPPRTLSNSRPEIVPHFC